MGAPMTTLTLPSHKYSSSIFIVLALIVVLTTLTAHAVERHGQIAVEINSYCSNGGVLETWVNPVTGRQANICQLPNGIFGIQICEDNKAITCIPKEKLSRIEQVYNYLKNRGYLITK
jgi:putative hemolysin